MKRNMVVVEDVSDKTVVFCCSDIVVGMMWSPWGSRAKWWKPWDWKVSPKDVLKIFVSEERKTVGYVFPGVGVVKQHHTLLKILLMRLHQIEHEN